MKNNFYICWDALLKPFNVLFWRYSLLLDSLNYLITFNSDKKIPHLRFNVGFPQLSPGKPVGQASVCGGVGLGSDFQEWFHGSTLIRCQRDLQTSYLRLVQAACTGWGGILQHPSTRSRSAGMMTSVDLCTWSLYNIFFMEQHFTFNFITFCYILLTNPNVFYWFLSIVLSTLIYSLFLNEGAVWLHSLQNRPIQA